MYNSNSDIYTNVSYLSNPWYKSYANKSNRQNNKTKVILSSTQKAPSFEKFETVTYQIIPNIEDNEIDE